MKNVIISILWLTCSIALADNKAYESKDYVTALDTYQSEIDSKGPNASLLYNLGNTYYRMGNYGHAIYAFERAQILAHGSSDIETNLALARKAATAFEESQSIKWLNFLNWLSYNQWAKVAVACLFLLAVISLFRGFDLLQRSPVSPKLPLISLLVLLAISITALILRKPELDRAIVINSKTKVRLSPFETADVKATLKSGQAVQIKQVHDKYYRIENGWVSIQDVKPLYSRP